MIIRFIFVDLHRFPMASNSISSLIGGEGQEYQPKTVKERNHGRYAYLPLYPTVAFGPNNHLLLANVPGSSI